MGFGDEIMASAAARRLGQSDPRARIVIGDGRREVWRAESAAIFAGNPRVTRLADVRRGERVRWLRHYYGHRPYLDYARSEPGRRQAFVVSRVEPGELYFTAAERRAAAVRLEGARQGRPLVAIEPHVDFGATKDWGWRRWQALVDALGRSVTFVQPDYGKPLLDGVIGLAGTFRGFAALLEQCDAYVGPEGGLHHAAAAVGCPAVVLFGGRLAPAITGYAGHENLYVDGPQSPCGMIADCPHCRACFAAIAVDAVAAAVRRQMVRRPERPRRSAESAAAQEARERRDGARRRVRMVRGDDPARQTATTGRQGPLEALPERAGGARDDR